MARQKDQGFEPKEQLQQALVPMAEQPYEVPENWVWVRLVPGFATCLDSYREPVNARERANRSGDVPYYGATGQVGWINEYLTDEQLVLVGEDGAPFFDLIKNKAYIIEGKAWVNNHAHILKSNHGEHGNYYLMHYLNCFNYDGYVNGTTRLKLTQASMNTIPIPIPPLPEQRRIVECIESLFTKLDTARELAQSALDSFETRKMAILQEALTGELTARWREAHGYSKISWIETTLGDVVDSFRYGISEKSDYSYGGIPIIRIPNILSGSIDFVDLKYLQVCDVIEDDALYENDLLIVRSNGSRDLVGKCALVPKLDLRYTYASYLIRLRPKAIIFPRFLLCYMNSTYAREQLFISAKSSAGINNVNIKDLSSIQLQLPDVNEQQEIVRILDSFFEKEKQAKELYEVVDKIDLMKKAILARAFRGELGTNDPNDESAIHLVQSIVKGG